MFERTTTEYDDASYKYAVADSCSLIIGYFSKKWAWITTEGIKALKALVSKVCLPMVLFNAFLTTTFSKSRLLVSALVLASMVILFAIGFLIRRVLKGHEKYMPFLVAGTESGMIGSPLAALLLGVEGTRLYAMADMAITIFFFVITVSALTLHTAKAVGFLVQRPQPQRIY